MMKTVFLTALIVGIMAALVITLILWIAADITRIADKEEKENP